MTTIPDPTDASGYYVYYDDLDTAVRSRYVASSNDQYTPSLHVDHLVRLVPIP